MTTFFLVLVLMISSHGVAGLGGSRLLLPCFVYLPMAAFFLVFFFGQELSFGLWSPSIWIDRFIWTFRGVGGRGLGTVLP